MGDMDQVRGMNVPRMLGGKPYLIAFAFTTATDGTPTLVDDLGDVISIVETTASTVYTVTLPKWVRTISCLVTHNLVATLNCTPTFTASSGSLVLTWSGNFNSARADVLLVASMSNVD